jgi:hypothetical protein
LNKTVFSVLGKTGYMKRLIPSLCLLLPGLLFAQKHTHVTHFDFPEVPATLQTVTKTDKAHLLSSLPEGIVLTPKDTLESLAGKHVHYAVHYRNQPVVNAYYVEHIYPGFTKLTFSLPGTSVKTEGKADAFFINEAGALVPCTVDSTVNALGIKEVNYHSEEGNYTIEQGVYHGRATATGYVFLPDPLTSANEAYAGAYTDNNDNTNAELDAERVQVNLEVTETGGLYTLENDYVRITEHSPPTVAPVTSSNGQFLFDRSESGFEDVNVLYHITEFQEYVQQLGFMNLGNYPLACDGQGFNGFDQSAFQWNPEQLTFGEGGVDDAEDADVIIHEYGHALSYAASPQSNIGTQRRALDEAIGDYLAVSYSKLVEEFEWYKVFNWDGHNEFWPGRLAISDAKYPVDLQNDLYDDAPLWSASLMQIEQNIGRDVTHQLLFESMFSWYSNMPMTNAAELFIQADSLLNNGGNYAYIGHIFLERGFIDTVNAPRPGDLVLSVQDDLQVKEPLFRILENPVSIGNEIKLECAKEGRIKIYSVNGTLIHSSTVYQGFNRINLGGYSGLFILRFSDNAGNTENLKVIIEP